MKPVQFTDEELFYIEQEFDFKASIVSQNIFKVSEQLLHAGALEQNKEYSDEVRHLLMHIIQEQHRCMDLIDSIRKKLEKRRQHE